MSKYIAVPTWLFELDRLSPSQKYLYICLRRLCNQDRNGEYSGTYDDLSIVTRYTLGYRVSSDLQVLYEQGLIALRGEGTKYSHRKLWHIRLTDERYIARFLANNQALQEWLEEDGKSAIQEVQS